MPVIEEGALGAFRHELDEAAAIVQHVAPRPAPEILIRPRDPVVHGSTSLRRRGLALPSSDAPDYPPAAPPGKVQRTCPIGEPASSFMHVRAATAAAFARRLR